MELKDKLGPINWQLMPTTKFDPADFEAFLKLLPKEVTGAFCAMSWRSGTRASALPRSLPWCASMASPSRLPATPTIRKLRTFTAPFIYARIMGTKKIAAAGLFRCGARALGRAGKGVGLGRRGGRGRMRRTPQGGRQESRCLPLCDQRTQGAESGRSDEPHRAPAASDCAGKQLGSAEAVGAIGEPVGWPAPLQLIDGRQRALRCS